MKVLYLLRHAKASETDASVTDFERPLTDVGRDEAERIGRWLVKSHARISLVVSSAAFRARETAEIVLRTASLDVQPFLDARIYEASLDTLVKVVNELPDDKGSVILVGHNPGMAELLSFLSRTPRQMPTCALAQILVNCSKWKEVERDSGRLDWIVMPRDLP